MGMQRVGLLLLTATLVASACGGETAAAATKITATLTDTGIALSQASIPAGKVTLEIVNKGTVVHSLVLLKTDLAHDKVPADPKDASKVQELGSLAATGQLAVGASKELTRDLKAGNYVLVCNEPAHYIVGMHTALVVK